jgi:hypothetical protein
MGRFLLADSNGVAVIEGNQEDCHGKVIEASVAYQHLVGRDVSVVALENTKAPTLAKAAELRMEGSQKTRLYPSRLMAL